MVASQEAGGAGLRYGAASMWSPLRRALVRRPATAGDFAGAGWRRPDPGLLIAQHEVFCELLAGLGCEVEVAAALDGLVDATYIRDQGLVTQRGGVVFQMAKPARQDEPGCEVHCYDGSEISLKGDGGPTCLTQPLLRAG
jgi:N-dimethylarginine dimethylaminohydrolase